MVMFAQNVIRFSKTNKGIVIPRSLRTNKEFVPCETFLLWPSSSAKNFIDRRSMSFYRDNLQSMSSAKFNLANLAKSG